MAILPQLAFVATSLLSLIFGVAYKRSTPNLYEGSSHTSLGWIVMVFAVVLNALDVARFAFRWMPGAASAMSRLAGAAAAPPHEAQPLVFDGDEHFTIFSPTEIADTNDGHQWSEVQMDQAERQHRHHHHHRSSSGSSDGDGTLYDSAGPAQDLSKIIGLKFGQSLRGRLARSSKIAVRLSETLLIVLAYVKTLSGIAIYSGSCRSSYLNG